MNFLSSILIDLQAVIAAGAARDRRLTVLLVAVWGRVARMRARLERLVALWRAGKLPKARLRQAARVRAARVVPPVRFPTIPGWLRHRLGYDVSACASQLQHALGEAECAAFLAAVPQAGRILRPLLRMLTPDAVPELIRLVRPVVMRVVAAGLIPAGVGVAVPGCENLEG